MKKLTAIILALLMTVCAAALAEDETWVNFADRYPEAKAFDSFWVSGDGTVRADAFCRDDCFEMNIVEMTGENTFNAWEYIMTYDTESGRLVCDGTGLKSANTFEDGKVTESHNEYEDGSATFFLDDEGNLHWDDTKEDTFQATTLIKIGKFPDVYLYDRAELEIRYAGEDLIYDVELDWADSAFQTWNWSLSGRYDPESDTLTVEGTKRLYTYKEDGELDLDADQQESEVKAVFTVNEDRSVTCASEDENINGITFERTWINMWQWVY